MYNEFFKFIGCYLNETKFFSTSTSMFVFFHGTRVAELSTALDPYYGLFIRYQKPAEND